MRVRLELQLRFVNKHRELPARRLAEKGQPQFRRGRAGRGEGGPGERGSSDGGSGGGGDGGGEGRGGGSAQWAARHEKGAKSRMPRRTRSFARSLVRSLARSLARARARLRRCDTFDARLSNKLSTLWHSRRNRASVYDRCREARHSRTGGRTDGYAGYGEGDAATRHKHMRRLRSPTCAARSA